jgi:hypothetical protein
MKTLKTVLLIASVAIFPLALSAGDLMKPETYYPIGPKLLQLTQYQINKVNTPEVPLTAKQIADLRVVLEQEATKLGEIQKKNLGDLTAILREGLPVICGTSAKILEILSPAQRLAAGNALVAERREGFLNTINMSLLNLFDRYETAAKIPELMAQEPGK